MAYATAENFIALFGETEWLQLTDRDNDDESDPGVATAALQSAADLIDGYARGIYQVPLAPVDPIVMQINLDLARWLLSGNAASDRVEEGRANAMRLLSDIAAQRLILTAALATTTSSAGLAYSTPDASGFFTRSAALPEC